MIYLGDKDRRNEKRHKNKTSNVKESEEVVDSPIITLLFIISVTIHLEHCLCETPVESII